MYKLVLIRHGQSTWNKKGLFTGWVDVPLTKQGRDEAMEASRLLRQKKFLFDLAFTSTLKRANETLNIILKRLDLKKIPVKIDWRLNERHYGDLEGLSKKAMAEKFGEEQVHIWRRSYAVRPPKIRPGNRYFEGHIPQYKELMTVIGKKNFPLAESLQDVVKRVEPCFKKEITPAILANKKVIVAASGNSLRVLIKYLDKLSKTEVSNLDIPTGVPLVYVLDKNLRPIKHYYLGDQKKIQAAIRAVRNQGKIII